MPPKVPNVLTTDSTHSPYREILRGSQLQVTAFVSALSLLIFASIYFFHSWQPKLLVEMGFSPSMAATIASTSSFAGACGTAIFGLLSRRWNGYLLTIVAVSSLGTAIAVFGMAPPIASVIVVIALLAGASIAASTMGLYVLAANAFEPAMRSTGTGFIIGVGRVGSALGPSIAGLLLGMGLGLTAVCLIISTCAFSAVLLLWRPPALAGQLFVRIKGSVRANAPSGKG